MWLVGNESNRCVSGGNPPYWEKLCFVSRGKKKGETGTWKERRKATCLGTTFEEG